MLPPILPHQIAVTSQQDPPKPKPDIPPVVPTQEAGKENAVSLDKRNPEETALRLREEQERRNRQQHEQRERERVKKALEEGEEDLEALEASLDPGISRKGLWVDIKA